MGDRCRQDEQGEPLEWRLRGRLPRGECDLAESQTANARDVKPSDAGQIAESHVQSAGPKTAVFQETVFHETVFQETLSQETLSHETLSHDTLRPTLAAYAAAR